MKTLNIFELEKLVNNIPCYDENLKRKPFSSKVKEQIKEKYNYKCAVCWEKEGSIAHHIFPQGDATLENGIALCETCHMIIHIYLKMFKGYTWLPVLDKRFEMLSHELIYHLVVVGSEIRNINSRLAKVERITNRLFTKAESKLLKDILGHINYDESESETFRSLCKKCDMLYYVEGW